MIAYGAGVALTLALAHAARARGLTELAAIVAAAWVLRVALFLLGGPHWANTAIDAAAMMLIAPRALNPAYPGRGVYALVAAIIVFQAGFRLALTVLAAAPGAPGWLSGVLAHGLNRTFDLTLVILIVFAVLRLVRRRWPCLHKAIWKKDGHSLRRNFAATLDAYYAEAAGLADDPDHEDRFVELFARQFRRHFLGAAADAAPTAGSTVRNTSPWRTRA